MTDNWLELTLRFVVTEHGVRDVKDALARDILKRFEEAGIGIASATFELVGLPPLKKSIPIPQGPRRAHPAGAATVNRLTVNRCPLPVARGPSRRGPWPWPWPWLLSVCRAPWSAPANRRPAAEPDVEEVRAAAALRYALA